MAPSSLPAFIALLALLRHVCEAASDPRPSIVNCTWERYQMPIDHFSTHDSGTFEQRVCLYTNYYVNDAAAAPMFFYTGNESPVEEYINNTGLMWELGARLGGIRGFKIVCSDYRKAALDGDIITW